MSEHLHKCRRRNFFLPHKLPSPLGEGAGDEVKKYNHKEKEHQPSADVLCFGTPMKIGRYRLTKPPNKFYLIIMQLTALTARAGSGRKSFLRDKVFSPTLQDLLPSLTSSCPG
jgi:hypothetical protein